MVTSNAPACRLRRASTLNPCPRATRSTTRRGASDRSSRGGSREIAHPHPRLRGERWPQKLAGRAVTRVDAHGKHLFVHFEGDLAIHSHLRMTGSWGTYRPGQRWRRAHRRAWLVLRTDEGEAVQFDGPVLELLTESRTRFDRRLAMLGPDILAAELDEQAILAPPARRR